MGFEYHIDIVGKVKHNKNVVWYFDKNGIRYTDADIRRILGCLNEPMNVRLSKLNNFMAQNMGVARPKDVDRISVNMRLSGNKLVSTCGTLRVMTCERRVILVICEDSSSGKQLYMRLLHAMYPNVLFRFVSSYGNKGLEKAFNSEFNRLRGSNIGVIIISDYKVEDGGYIKNLKKIEKSIENSETNIPIWMYTPICVEEAMLSNLKLRVKFRSPLLNKLQNYTKTGEKYYRCIYSVKYGCEVYEMFDGSLIQNLEVALAKELFNVSLIPYSKKFLSSCFVDECCPRRLMGKAFRCNRYSANSGYDDYSGDGSLIGGLQNIVNDILGIKDRYLTWWKREYIKDLYWRCS